MLQQKNYAHLREKHTDFEVVVGIIGIGLIEKALSPSQYLTLQHESYVKGVGRS